jgi:glycosyltransferase involved in cell wall biosynthesis
MPLVSVIIPTYNRFEHLNHAIQSVINQSFQDFEIIVINDCSTQPQYYNGQLELYPKTTIIHLPVNLKTKYNVTAAQGQTRQHGLNISNGTWICFLDDDDYWLPNKLEIQLNALSKYPQILLCSTNMFYGNGLYDKSLNYPVYHTKSLPHIFDFNHISNCNNINNSTVIIHKSICQRVGEFKLGNTEDYDYWLRSLKFTDCLYINEPLIYYDLGHAGKKNYIYT